MDLVHNWDRIVTMVGGVSYAIWNLTRSLRFRNKREGNGIEKLTHRRELLEAAVLTDHEKRILKLEYFKASLERERTISGKSNLSEETS